MALERGRDFLELGFDWYVLEHWDQNSPESRVNQHIHLGFEYARLGHYGRRPYVMKAAHYFWRPEDVALLRPGASVPNDLLTPQERRVNMFYRPIWVRTDYESDARHEEILGWVDNSEGTAIFGSDCSILDSASRYSSLSDGNAKERLLAILAFVPVLTEHSGSFYDNDEIEWESEDMQSQLILENEDDSETERKQKRATLQRTFFVADKEAMLTGWVLWIHLDEFGNVIQQNRVRPDSLREISTLMDGLHDHRVGFKDGLLDGFHHTGTVTSWSPSSVEVLI